MSPAFHRPEPISDRHDVGGFSSGKDVLDTWLKERALDNERRGATRTFVASRGRRVVGYYSLAVSAVHRRETTGRVRRNMPEPVPAMLLARLAVDRSEQGAGLGRQLLRDAMLRTLQAADIAGIRILLVHAIDDRAKAWYEQFDFEESPTDPMQLMLLLTDVREALR